MHFAEQAVDDGAVGAHFVVTGLFAARMADAAHGGAHGGSGAAHVEADFVELVEGLLDVLGGAALEHDVAALAVQGDQAGTVTLPDVAHLAQQIGAVMHAGGRLDAQGMKFLRRGKFLGDFREAGDHPAAIPIDPDRSALPIAPAGLV